MNYASENNNHVRYNQLYCITVEVSKDIEVGNVGTIITHEEGVR